MHQDFAHNGPMHQDFAHNGPMHQDFAHNGPMHRDSECTTPCTSTMAHALHKYKVPFTETWNTQAPCTEIQSAPARMPHAPRLHARWHRSPSLETQAPGTEN